MVRDDVPAHRHRRRRPGGHGPVRAARSSSRRARRSRRPTSSSSSSTRPPASRPATRSWPTSCGDRGATCSWSRTSSTTRVATPRRSSSTGSASGIRSRSRRCTATARATCSTRSWGGFPAAGEKPIGEEAIRVAILGRPNVGKSSLLNALVGRERVIVSEVPGTTRDTIDTVLERGDSTFVLVDTAGLRRKRKQRQGIEYYSELRALEAAERADVALVLVDASEGVVDQDLAVADVARKAGCATVVVLSKWDVDRGADRGRAPAARDAAPAASADPRRLRPRPAAASSACSTRSRRSSRSTRDGSRPPSSTVRSRSCARRGSRRGGAGAGSISCTGRR